MSRFLHQNAYEGDGRDFTECIATLNSARPEKENDADTYSVIFRALKHPIRRRILSLLADKPLTFSEMLRVLSVDSGHLSYHLEALTHLISKTEDGRYRLSAFGNAALGLFTDVEGTVSRKQATPIGRVLGSIQSISKKRLLAVILILGLLVTAGVSANHYFTTPRLLDVHPAWSIQLGQGPVLADMTMDGKYLAVAEISPERGNSTLYKFDNQGNEYWRYRLNDLVLNLAISPFANFIVVYGHSLYLFGTNGNLWWSRSIQGLGRVAVTESGNVIASRNDSIMYFDTNGASRWNMSLTVPTLLKPAEASPQFVVIANPFSSQDTVSLLDQDGSRLWTRLVDGHIAALFPDVSHGHILAATSSNEAYLLDWEGQLIWTIGIPSPVASVSLTVDGKFALVASQEGILYAYDTDGRLVGQHKIGYGPSANILLSFIPDAAVVGQAEQKSWLHFFEIESVVTIPKIPNELFQEILLVAVLAVLVIAAFWIVRREKTNRIGCIEAEKDRPSS